MKIGKYTVVKKKPLWWVIMGIAGGVVIGGAYSWILLICIAGGAI